MLLSERLGPGGPGRPLVVCGDRSLAAWACPVGQGPPQSTIVVPPFFVGEMPLPIVGLGISPLLRDLLHAVAPRLRVCAVRILCWGVCPLSVSPVCSGRLPRAARAGLWRPGGFAGKGQPALPVSPRIRLFTGLLLLVVVSVIAVYMLNILLKVEVHFYSLDAGATINTLTFSPKNYWLCAATDTSIKV